MLKTIFSNQIYQSIITCAAPIDMSEIRLKADAEVLVFTIYNQLLHTGIKATQKDIQAVVNTATDFSRYAYEEEIRSGYLTLGKGYRVGLSGVFIDKGGSIELKNCTSVVVRVPHEVFRASAPLNALFAGGANIVIMSPPGGGKTTMLRDAARELSERKKALVVDERFEIGGFSGELNVGRADLVQGVRKGRVLEGVIRAMSPETVLLDELYGDDEFQLIQNLAASGIGVIATLHADTVNNALKRFPKLKEVFQYAVTLTSKPRAGSIQSIERL